MAEAPAKTAARLRESLDLINAKQHRTMVLFGDITAYDYLAMVEAAQAMHDALCAAYYVHGTDVLLGPKMRAALALWSGDASEGVQPAAPQTKVVCADCGQDVNGLVCRNCGGDMMRRVPAAPQPDNVNLNTTAEPLRPTFDGVPAEEPKP